MKTSEAMKHLLKMLIIKTKAILSKLSLAKGYATKRECSAQEAVNNKVSELWLRKCLPGVLFANSTLR